VLNQYICGLKQFQTSWKQTRNQRLSQTATIYPLASQALVTVRIDLLGQFKQRFVGLFGGFDPSMDFLPYETVRLIRGHHLLRFIMA
jgi:hypothetical protein